MSRSAIDGAAFRRRSVSPAPRGVTATGSWPLSPDAQCRFRGIDGRTSGTFSVVAGMYDLQRRVTTRQRPASSPCFDASAGLA